MKAESDISVAIVYPGGRVDRLTKPLFATDMDVGVEPNNPYDRDIVLLDNADKWIWVPIVKGRNKNCKVVYRIRGDMLRAYREMNQTPLKYWIAKYCIGKVDGAVSIEKVLAERFERATGVSPIGYASLVKEPSEWPTVSHMDREIRAVTLTNTNYMGKIQPLIEYAPVINRFLVRNGGYWNVYGKGNKSKYLYDCLKNYEKISFKGYTDNPKATLATHNVMLHLSDFDSMPNAILEGMASDIPVVTNPYSVFTSFEGPLTVASMDDMNDTLRSLESPNVREAIASEGWKYLMEYHTPEAVGQQYVKCFQGFLRK